MPSVVALLGWTYIFLTSGHVFILYGLLILAAGIAAFWIWRRKASPQAA